MLLDIVNSGGVSLFYEWFAPYAFHLALFVFTSGYFYKEDNEKHVTKYIWKKFKRLIIPMYIWNLIYGIFVQITRLKDFTIGGDFNFTNLVIAPITNGHQFIYNMASWFLVPLFIVETINVIFRKLAKKIKIRNEYVFSVVYLLLGMAGIKFASEGNYAPGWQLLLDRVLYFLPFYGLGILYKTKLEEKDKLNNIAYFSIVFLLQLIVITANKGLITYTPSWCNNFTGDLILPFIIAILGIAFWLRVARIIEPIIKNSKVVNLIADNTYAIMMHQFMGFFIVKTIFALLSKFIPMFKDFNWNLYKTDIWYLYLPENLSQWRIVYLIAGIAIPIVISISIRKLFKLINKTKNIKFRREKCQHI